MSSESSSSSAPQLPAFHPIDIGKTVADALQYDVQGFDWSDQDFLSRFPGLVSTRNAEIDRAYNQLTGPLDPTVQNSFVTGAIGSGLSSVGGGDPLSGLGMTAGSAGRNAATANFGQSLLNKQDADRSYFDALIGNNPERAFGISGEGVSNLAIANSSGLNAANQQSYTAQLSNIYQQGQVGSAQGQQLAAIAGILARLGSSFRTSGGGYGGG